MTFANWCNYVETGGERRLYRKAFDVVPHIQCEALYSGRLCAEVMMVMYITIFLLQLQTIAFVKFRTDYCISNSQHLQLRLMTVRFRISRGCMCRRKCLL